MFFIFGSINSFLVDGWISLDDKVNGSLEAIEFYNTHMYVFN